MEEFKQALTQKAGFECVQETPSENQLRLVGRIPSNKTGQWLRVMEQLLLHAQNAAWNIDLSKQYFLRGSRVLYGWRIIVQAAGVAQYDQALASIVASTPAVQAQLQEVRLYGRGSNDAIQRGGRGAQPLFTAVVGPAMKNMRG